MKEQIVYSIRKNPGEVSDDPGSPSVSSIHLSDADYTEMATTHQADMDAAIPSALSSDASPAEGSATGL